jgi:DNA-binding CsgD family transcriptional regulator
MSVSEEQLAALASQAAEVVRIEELAEEFLPGLRDLLAASSTLLFGFDASGAPRGLGGELAGALPEYSVELFERDPLQQRLLATPARAGLVVDSGRLFDGDLRQIRRSAAYSYFYRPLEVEHLLAVWPTDAPYGSSDMVGVLLTRSYHQGPFPEAAAPVLQALHAPLGAAVRRGRRLAEQLEQGDVLEWLLGATAASPRLVLGRRGVVRWAASGAADLLGEPLRPGATAPEPLRLAALRFESWLAGGDAFAPAPVAFRLRSASAGHRPLAVELAPAETARRRRFVAVTLAEQTVPVLEAFAAHHGLTPAEARALALLAEGLSDKAIAQRLFVSLATVKTHVHRVLDKLSVRSRTQAAMLLTRWSPAQADGT